MKIEEIIGLKECIENISDENCILFLWVTFPCLLEGLEVMKQWGFKYKTCGFNWVKRNKKVTHIFWIRLLDKSKFRNLFNWNKRNNKKKIQ